MLPSPETPGHVPRSGLVPRQLQGASLWVRRVVSPSWTWTGRWRLAGDDQDENEGSRRFECEDDGGFRGRGAREAGRWGEVDGLTNLPTADHPLMGAVSPIWEMRATVGRRTFPAGGVSSFGSGRAP